MATVKSSYMLKMSLLILVSAACLGAAIISPCLPQIAKYFGVNNNQIGMLTSIYLLGYLFGQFFYAALSEKYSFRIALQIGFSIYVLFVCAQIISIHFHVLYLLYLSRFFCAFGASSGLVCSFAMIKSFFNNRESQKLLSLAFISLTLFAYLSIAFGGVISNLFGWKVVFDTLVFIAGIQFFIIYKFIPNEGVASVYRVRKNNGFFKNYLNSLCNIKLLLSSLFVASTTTTTYLYSTTVPAISYDIFHLSPDKFGLFSILNLIGLLAGGWIFFHLSKKRNAMNILLCGLLTTLVPLAFFLIFNQIIFNNSQNPILFFLLTSVINLGLGLIYPSASYLSLNSISSDTTASSIMNSIKIGSPIVILTLVSKSNLSIINCFILPLTTLIYNKLHKFFSIENNCCLCTSPS